MRDYRTTVGQNSKSLWKQHADESQKLKSNSVKIEKKMDQSKCCYAIVTI